MPFAESRSASSALFAPAATAEPPLALVGGTIVDVSNGGSSSADLRDAVVVLDREAILAAATLWTWPRRCGRRWLGPRSGHHVRASTSCWRGLDPGDAVVENYAHRLAASGVALIPTLSLYASELPGRDNPWREPIAQILDPKDIHLPVDRVTGRPPPAPGVPTGLSASVLRLEARYCRAGAKCRGAARIEVEPGAPARVGKSSPGRFESFAPRRARG